MTLLTDHRREATIRWPEGLHLACFALFVANVAFLVGAALTRNWIVDADGHPIHIDFTGLYAAGRLVLDGQSAAAYDWTLHHATENALIGHDSADYFGWHYPPPFLIVAGLLALLPYTAAFVVWLVATLPLYLATIRAIIGDKIGWLIAAALPCLMPNIISGQNGFLTASLLGGALVLLRRRPALAGVCLGLLSYKPQFGLLIPLALVAGGYWRAIGVAAIATGALGLATIALIGVSAWVAFFHWAPLTSQAFLFQDHGEWYKIQSLFALVRMLGGGPTLAWALQLCLTVAAAIAICIIWWDTRIAFELKAAALAAAVPLATPIVYLYDLTLLGVSTAFLIRCALATGFLRGEIAGLAFITALLLIMPFLGVPVGLFAAMLLVLLIVRRMVFQRTIPGSSYMVLQS